MVTGCAMWRGIAGSGWPSTASDHEVQRFRPGMGTAETVIVIVIAVMMAGHPADLRRRIGHNGGHGF
jgi:hypothetical protein